LNFRAINCRSTGLGNEFNAQWSQWVYEVAIRMKLYITNVSGAIDAKYSQMALRSVLVHKPALLG
jgi:hypothetical protein